ncbi:MAG: insulinase family protein [Flavobacteriales bacterium]|nr:insulinase family protein [Flavobacteriales bacterium]
MKKTKLFVTSAVVAFLLVTCGDKDQHQEENKYKYDYETVENDPLNTLIYTLDNGLKIYMSVNKDEPRIQTNIAVNTGSKQDPSDATGLAHYLEHMLFKGTSEIASLDWETEKSLLKQISDLYEKRRGIEDEAERKAIYHQIDSLSGEAAKYVVPNEYDKMISSLGAKGTNAYTSLERTVYVNDIPSNEFEKWLTIESERFSELVLRLFHTELEAVYEEFNRGQDSDWRLAYYTMMSALFKNHTYGTQTTIGTSDHLKNPSMEKIHEYFNTYYVPNNMAIILAGDLDPDQTVDLIKKYFGEYQTKKVPEFTFEQEEPITAPVIIDVQGTDAEWVDIGFRMPGVQDADIYKLQLMDNLLANGQAGLIDLELVKAQKVLNGYSSFNIAKDYSTFLLHATPREGQTLEEAKSLLLGELEKIKKGEFEDWMLEASIKNFKLQDQRNNEHNSYRTYKMTNAFILEQDWSEVAGVNDKLSKLTKKDIVDFANTYFHDNYVVVNKRTGKRDNVKVDKPAITQVTLNRDTTSAFAKKIETMEATRMQPIFDDYKKDVIQDELNHKVPFYYVENTTNEIFTLNYILDMGKFSDKELALAVKYLEYLGTDQYSAADLQTELYKLGLSYSVYAANERVYVSLSGLEESLNDGVKLFEHILSNVQPNQEAYDNVVQDILKERADEKLSKWNIFYGAMLDYGKYGPESPQKHILSETELKAIDVTSLVNKIKGLTSYEHYVYYYGRKDKDEVKNIINEHHQTPEELIALIPAKTFPELEMEKNRVYFVNHDMVQSEVMMLSKAGPYNKDLAATTNVFNEYFGSGLSSIIFQEIRESKALAYSAYSYFSTPEKLDQSHYVRAYIGTQVDKLGDAKKAMIELMNNMPEVGDQFEDAKLAALKKIETSRTKRSSLFWKYIRAKELGRDYDLNTEIYPAIQGMQLTDLKGFFDAQIKGRTYTYLVIGNKDLVDVNVLKEMGEYKEVSLEELFGY